MGLREALNKNPKASAAVGFGLFAVAVGWVAWVVLSESAATSTVEQPKAWYSTDDGATWFADAATRTTPFQTPDGKTAVKANVFRCPHGKTFVAYLERNAPAAAVAAEQQKIDKSNPYAGQMAVYRAGVQVKAPKSDKWVPINDPAAIKIITLVCPDGGDQVEPLQP